MALAVFAAALATALTTGLGALPFVFWKRPTSSWVGVADALAAGFMAAASLLLFYTGWRESAVLMLSGAVTGAAFVAWISRLLSGQEAVQFGSLAGADARRALLLVGVMTVHSFAEGVGVGVAFGEGKELGAVTALAIAIHNIPEGLAISLALVPRGKGVFRAAAWSVFSSLPQPLVALPAFAFVDVFAGVVPVGLGFAGGAMVWMVVAQVLPAALGGAPGRAVVLAFGGATAVMLAVEVLLLA